MFYKRNNNYKNGINKYKCVWYNLYIYNDINRWVNKVIKINDEY